MTNVKSVVNVISNNKETIKRKLVVAVGTAVGMLLASAVIDRLNEKTPDVIYIEVPVDRTDDSSDFPIE